MIKYRHLAFFLLLISMGIGVFIVSLTQTQSAHVARSLGVAEPSPTSSQYYQKLLQTPQHSRYQLTYPGILPTHPLYSFKMIRDRILLVLTPSHRQAVLLLLYADKRLASAEILINQGRVDRAVTVATKGMTYYWRALEAVPKLPKGLRSQAFLSLNESQNKYQDILNKLANVTESSAHDQVVRLQQNLETYQKHLLNLSGLPVIVKPSPSSLLDLDDSLKPRI